MNQTKGEFMFKELKMKIAARRVERKKARLDAAKKSRNSKKPQQSFWAKTWFYICKPFQAIWRGLKNLWAWIRSLDLIGLVNLTLLSAIIVLFSMLIIDMVGCNKKPVVIIARNDMTTIEAEPVKVKPAPKPHELEKQVAAKPAPLPLKKDAATRKFIDAPINVAKVEKCTVAERQTARVRNTMYGDVIIDSRGAATMLKAGDVVKGNLYLQNMRKYTLPCDMRIEGNLFLRDMGMLQFCGDFTVTGNIYVSPRSSFGPIPRTARLGGQVIL